jgi:hypothetical protein
MSDKESQSDVGNLIIDEEGAYRALLITEAHDCNHDFFQPKETFAKKLTQGGGAKNEIKKRKGDQDNQSNQGIPKKQKVLTRPGNGRRLKRKGRETPDEQLPRKIGRKSPLWPIVEGEVIYENMTDESLPSRQRVECLILSDSEIEILSDSDTDDFSLRRKIIRDLDDGFDIYDSILESVLLDEYQRRYRMIDTSEEIIPKPMEKYEHEQGGGGRPRRIRTEDVKKEAKLNEEKMIYGVIMKKIQAWDMTVIKIKYDTASPENSFGEDFNDIRELKDINAALEGGTEAYNEDCFYTFLEWVEKMNSLKCKLLNDILGDLNIKGETGERKSILFGKIVGEVIQVATDSNDLNGLMSALTKFSKYTSVPDMVIFGPSKTMSAVINFKIDLSTFIKKKWRRLNFGQLDAKALTFYNNFFRKTKPLLTKQDKGAVKILRDTMMKYWIKFAYGAGISDEENVKYPWVREWTELINRGGEITDEKLRDSFIKYEYKNKIKGRGIFYDKYPHDKVRKEDYSNLQGIAKNAFDNNAVGNNVAIDSHYIKNYNKSYPSKIQGWLFEDKKRYNCNYVNVADPGSTCPKYDCNLKSMKCDPFDISLYLDKKLMMKAYLDPGKKNNLEQGTFSYEISSLTGELPLVISDFSLKGKGSGSEGLSKTNILDKVFEKIGGIGTYRDKLFAFVKLLGSDKTNKLIRGVIQIFGLKLFGDFSQELFSVKQSYSKKTVFVGNDWISSIRYLFLQKHVSVSGKQLRQHDWWGGFMGGSDCFLMTNIGSPDGVPASASAPALPADAKQGKKRKKSRKRKYKMRKTKKRTYRRRS